MKSILGKKKGKSIIHFDKENNCSFFLIGVIYEKIYINFNQIKWYYHNTLVYIILITVTFNIKK